jgi:hypothetical protein
MSYTDLEYRLVKFHALHQYDTFANPDKVGLGRCRCGEDMYYCEHDPHFARALIAEFGLREERRTNAMSSAGMTVDTKTGETTHYSDIRHDYRWVTNWQTHMPSGYAW